MKVYIDKYGFFPAGDADIYYPYKVAGPFDLPEDLHVRYLLLTQQAKEIFTKIQALHFEAVQRLKEENNEG